MGENKQVRVDNWGIFFLQRLQLFFSKTDYCDLTLQFQGNVQLKVHRLVLYACTEYFELLEHSDRLIDDNVLLMPEVLQTDVVVPIINFMYTGMLEYPMGLYQKLYQAADLMHLTVLTKLLDAQKQPIHSSRTDSTEVIKSSKSSSSIPRSSSSLVTSQNKKVTAKNNYSELPAPLPGRKLPVWKRKTVLPSSSISGFSRSESRVRSDPIALEDAGKPTRFEWPEDDLDLPPLDTMDISEFGDISYTSKPLLREDDVKPMSYSQGEVNKKQVKEENQEMPKEDKHVPEDSNKAVNDKRKINTSSEIDRSPKRIKIVESEKDTTISVISSGNSMNFDPSKIVSEILKKYPALMKKNKNIKLKIVTKQKEKDTMKPNEIQKEIISNKDIQILDNSMKMSEVHSKDNTWSCKNCTEISGKPMQFMLYYLYRKHMTDVHNIKFDPRICKYCGISYARGDLHSFHLFTKHGIKPSGNLVFPSCSQCPYVALSKQALQTHRSKHRKAEMQCSECKLAFVSRDAISSHIQITGHMGKARKNIYDCQYCMKTSQSAISLLSHIKSNHESEGIRDGIVSLDEIDLDEGVELDEEDHVEEGEADGEYIIPEIRSPPAKKVKIISDVKVPATKNLNRNEEVALDHNKVQSGVPSSIATSLGLLDIVVLDDSQQFILQNQEEQTGENRTEYILPQIGARNIRTDALATTTDELVMVLTDQDYKDGHSTITTDNSNIVVLYSHPADGQQGQFITSQGNLMVNSDTGLLEIRNGATIATTSSNQIVVTESESDIETIEMIHREIHGSQVLKQEPIYEEEHKPQVSNITESKDNSNPDTNAEIQEHNEQNTNIDEHVETVTDAQLENASVEEVCAPVSTKLNEVGVEPSFEVNEQDRSVEDAEVVDDVVEGSAVKPELSNTNVDVSTSEDTSTMENEQSESMNANVEYQTQTHIIPFTEYGNDSLETIENESNSESHDMPQKSNIEETDVETSEKRLVEEEVLRKETSEVEEEPVETCHESNITEDSLKSSSNEKDAEKPYSPTDNPIDMECEIESNLDINDKQDNESVTENETSIEVSHCEVESDNQDSLEISQCEVENDNQDSMEISQCEVETDIQDNDDNSLSSLEPSQAAQTDNAQQNPVMGPEESAKISILDDWEDTDSQQSENKTKIEKKGAEETVHKLMDDWEEEVEK